MKVYFKSEKDRKIFCSEKELLKMWTDKKIVERIMNRISALCATDNLDDVDTLPPLRCHMLKGDREGCFAINVDKKLRLVFKPKEYQETLSGGIDKKTVVEIVVLEVTDYHDR